MAGRLRVTSDGATGSPFSFALSDRHLVLAREIPLGGLLQRDAAAVDRGTSFNSPWSITTWDGIGVNLAASPIRNRDNRLWVSENVMTIFPCFACLGPNKRTTTFPAEVAAVEYNLFAHAAGDLWMGGTKTSTASTADEVLLYWDGSGWADTTFTDDAGGNPGTVEVRGIIHQGSTVYVLMNSGADNQTEVWLATDRATWTIMTNLPSTGTSPRAGTGFVTNGSNMWCCVNHSTATLIRKTADAGATAWSTAHTIKTGRHVNRGMVMWDDGAGTLDPWVTFSDGLYHVDDSAAASTRVQVFNHPESSYSGQSAETPFGLLYSDGPDLYLGDWSNNGRWQAVNLTARLEHGWPALKRGDITAVAFDHEKSWVLMAKGGDASGRNAGVYAFKLEENVFLTGAGTWHNIYYNGTANRVIFALFPSTETAGTPNLHIAEDNATASDSDAFRFQDYNQDPRLVSSYQHAASGNLILPKNDRSFREAVGTWRLVEGWGTGFDANNYLTAYHSGDAAPIDSDGSWTQLESSAGSGTTITASGGRAYFPATTDTTGAAARAQQLRILFTGTSNASPYLEIFNIYVQKLPAPKFIYEFIIDIWTSAGGGTIQSRQKVMTDIRNLVASTTDLQCQWAEEAATVLQPWRHDGGAIQWEEASERMGTVNNSADVRYVRLLLAEV